MRARTFPGSTVLLLHDLLLHDLLLHDLLCDEAGVLGGDRPSSTVCVDRSQRWWQQPCASALQQQQAYSFFKVGVLAGCNVCVLLRPEADGEG